jgi:hypothetical protein
LRVDADAGQTAGAIGRPAFVLETFCSMVGANRTSASVAGVVGALSSPPRSHLDGSGSQPATMTSALALYTRGDWPRANAPLRRDRLLRIRRWVGHRAPLDHATWAAGWAGMPNYVNPPRQDFQHPRPRVRTVGPRVRRNRTCGDVGELTFLMTDVEESTRLWEQDPAAVATALKRHDELAAEIVGARRGRLVKPRGDGDSLLVVFAQSADAVGCAVALQQGLRGVTWPQGAALRVADGGAYRKGPGAGMTSTGHSGARAVRV